MTTQKKIIKKAGGIIRDGQLYYAVQRNQYNDISLAKGHVEIGETDEQTALREVTEETGLQCKIVGDLGFVEYLNYEGIVQVHYFAMTIENKITDILSPDVSGLIYGNESKIFKSLSYITDKNIFQKGIEFFKDFKA